MSTNAELIAEARDASVDERFSGEGDGELYSDLADALEAAEAERARLAGIIEEARNFDGMQTVNGVTDEGWMSPDEWLLGKIDDILAQATPEEAAK